MKKFVTIALTAALSVSLLAGCGGSNADKNADADANTETDKVITVAASPSPHAEILAVAKEVLAADGYDLQVTEFTDYVKPNMVVSNGELDANYFQHQPYLTDFNAENKTSLVSAVAVHYEPFGIYSKKHTSLDELTDGAVISVPNDTTNEARALQLLQANGIITLKENAGLAATKTDIVENPHNVDIQEIEAAGLPPTLDSADFSVINGNYAIPAGLNVAEDALASEDKESEAAQTFANIVAVREGDENSEKIQALVKALTSDEVKNFINEKYEGAVVPIF